MGKDLAVALLSDTSVGVDVAPHVLVLDSGIAEECWAISKKSMVRDFTVVIRRRGEEFVRITIPANTPPDTPIVVQRFSVEPPVLNVLDILTFDIVCSDFSAHRYGVVSIRLRQRTEPPAKRAQVMGKALAVALLSDTSVGVDVAHYVLVLDSGIAEECWAISKKSMVRDFIAVIRRRGEEFVRITIPANTPPDTPIVVRRFSVEPPMLNVSDMLTVDIVCSDFSAHRHGVVSIRLRGRPALAEHTETRSRRGDPALLRDSDSVNFVVAEEYLGVSPRQRQRLIKKGSLCVVGRGTRGKITCDSLRTYQPPKDPT